MAHEPPAQAASADLEVEVRARCAVGWLIGTCLVAELGFVAFDYFVNFGRATRIDPIQALANIANEGGLASWFASAQTLLIGVTLWSIRGCSRADARASQASRWGWLVLALVFTWMAFDDGSQIHERVGRAFEELAAAEPPDGAPAATGGVLANFPSYMWQIVVLPGLAAATALGLALVWRVLAARRLRRLVLAGLGCLALAVALDFFEGLDADHPWNLYTPLVRRFAIEPWSLLRFGRNGYDTVEHFSKSIEEYLEMLGNTLLWWAFLRYLTRMAGTLRVCFR